VDPDVQLPVPALLIPRCMPERPPAARLLQAAGAGGLGRGAGGRARGRFVDRYGTCRRRSKALLEIMAVKVRLRAAPSARLDAGPGRLVFSLGRARGPRPLPARASTSRRSGGALRAHARHEARGLVASRLGHAARGARIRRHSSFRASSAAGHARSDGARGRELLAEARGGPPASPSCAQAGAAPASPRSARFVVFPPRLPERRRCVGGSTGSRLPTTTGERRR